MWGLITGIATYFPASWYGRRWLNEQGFESGFLRGVIIFLFASAVSAAAGSAVSWMMAPIDPSPQHVSMQAKANQLLGLDLRCMQDDRSSECAKAQQRAQQLLP